VPLSELKIEMANEEAESRIITLEDTEEEHVRCLLREAKG
jgi:hypothetical protein